MGSEKGFRKLSCRGDSWVYFFSCCSVGYVFSCSGVLTFRVVVVRCFGFLRLAIIESLEKGRYFGGALELGALCLL